MLWLVLVFFLLICTVESQWVTAERFWKNI